MFQTVLNKKCFRQIFAYVDFAVGFMNRISVNLTGSMGMLYPVRNIGQNCPDYISGFLAAYK
jgi:hypothetical protein